MEEILLKIIEAKKKRIEERKNIVPLEEVYIKANNIIKNSKHENIFKKEFLKDNFIVIGEFKKASPSKGIIVKDFDLDKILKYYNNLNIDIFSFLTEEDYFLGNDENFKIIRNGTEKPMLRKDFIIDFYQIYESVLLGADAILLIASVLGEDTKKFYDEAIRFNLQPLVEVHNKEELDLALKYDFEIIGINNRNLKSFDTSLNITENLIKSIPKNKKVIAESGIGSLDDIEKMKNLGVSGILVGEMFMKNIENEVFIRNYKKEF